MNPKFNFRSVFQSLTDHPPFPWQEALYEWFVKGEFPETCSLPTGLGKTSIIAVWLIALAERPDLVPRRLVYVVNRRTVVDQTTVEVDKVRGNLKQCPEVEAALRDLCAIENHDGTPVVPLGISTLRGQFADNQEWSSDPARPAVICGTVDMIGSRLLFGGYRCGFKSRPLHAGFLGQDALLVHDEAHLEPAFQRVIEALRDEQQREPSLFGDRHRLRVIELSATARGQTVPFELSDADFQHSVVKERIEAVKQLALHSLEDEKKELVGAIVERALEYEQRGRAVLIFLRSVDSVEKVAGTLRKHAQKRVETLTGTLRGKERDELVETPTFARFLPPGNRPKDVEPAEGTVYLVCTSAGEVGVNISADDLVCDLSTFDSMAQRFGRVNRFGERDDTRIDVVSPDAFGGKGTNADVEACRQKTLELLKHLDGDASPHALDQLETKARADAFAPEPVILPATDILFDAWALTTIRDKMPGRPPVEPYLHGVADWEPPQTQVAWREEVEIITGDLRERYQPQDLLEAYPLKSHELLRDRSDRVFKHLATIADAHPDMPVWLVGEQGSVDVLFLKDLADKKMKDRINGQIVVLSPQVGGLNGGLLDGKWKSADDVADEWFDENENQRRMRVWDDAEPPKGMALIRTIDINPDAGEFDGTDDETEETSPAQRLWHWYVMPRDAEDATRASAKPIPWEHHTRDVVEKTSAIAKALELPDEFQQAIILAAEWHDLGKQRELWQRGIGNPNPTDWHAKPGKPDDGPRWRPRRLSPYRHEFGSLLDILDPKQEYLKQLEQLDGDMQELVLHLIAAHHGRARPHFSQDETIDPERPQSQADEQALETPRRFARLQRKYGRWGLAYLESLLRAADWAASAEPSPLPTKTEEDHS